MRHKLIGLLEQSPVIPAVKDETALTRAAGCESRVLFLLGGDLLTIPGWIARTHEAGKQAVVHIDLVNGLAPKEVAGDWTRGPTAFSLPGPTSFAGAESWGC